MAIWTLTRVNPIFGAVTVTTFLQGIAWCVAGVDPPGQRGKRPGAECNVYLSWTFERGMVFAKECEPHLPQATFLFLLRWVDMASSPATG